MEAPESDTDLSGNVAVVTGASRRIGRATALRLARAGADVVLHGHRARDEVEAVAAEVEAIGRRALVVMADITDEAAVEGMFRRIEAEAGGVDILVNNAAIRGEKPLLEMSLAEWRQTMAVIVDGTFLCSREALRSMVARGGGSIVNIGGVTAHIGAARRAHVATAKAALGGLTRTLAVEFAPHGVRVNCIVPGSIGGRRSATAGAVPQMSKGSEDILLGREGTVEEVAHVIASFCLPGAGYVTGQTVHVNGGVYMN
ncbi:SDR family NAD(P)-dependent oxidoreductase [Lutibaculum baratangense]|uniref:3-oxoacyl-[acyl-carrier protein] reductase n=1 Tax=Lutibaculum baratangense AMV1 TaxID=631454 RepID=V4TLC3_9HYPH|nr:SDR family oxidoreductase [Lutibaculum baratangense]ESR26613.1 3-oxoacyl-[acyl-carrier protein] reductase [Lutibaculum baratangense AMV1]